LRGKKLFVDFVNAVRKSDEGYSSYYWQWKDDPKRIVPKLSHVRAFRPWQWVVGTGIYTEDVKDDIARIERRLIWISLGIAGAVSLCCFISPSRAWTSSGGRAG
jgi:signal transduction histidine kinase